MQLKFYRYNIIFALINAECIKMLENREKIVCSNWINVLAKKIGIWLVLYLFTGCYAHVSKSTKSVQTI